MLDSDSFAVSWIRADDDKGDDEGDELTEVGISSSELMWDIFLDLRMNLGTVKFRAIVTKEQVKGSRCQGSSSERKSKLIKDTALVCCNNKSEIKSKVGEGGF